MLPVTVDKAISHGKLHLIYIPLLLFIGSISAGMYITTYVNEWYVFVGAFVAGIVLAWLYWAFAVPKWRIWAFENVRNVHELKRRAIKEKLIWPDDSIYGHTEIRTTTQKAKLAQLERKFEREDIFRDDLSVPKQTAIYYSRNSLIFELVVAIVVIAVGSCLSLMKDNGYIIGLICIAIGVYTIIKSYRKLSNKHPQLVITAEGIESAEFKFISWSRIAEWQVVNRNKTNYLEINDNSIDIDMLNISVSRLKYLLELYNQRHENL